MRKDGGDSRTVTVHLKMVKMVSVMLHIFYDKSAANKQRNTTTPGRKEARMSLMPERSRECGGRAGSAGPAPRAEPQTGNSPRARQQED